VPTNGSGTIPPSPLTAVTRYRPPRRSLVRVAGKLLSWIVAVLLVAGGALAGGAWLFINESVEAVRAHTPEAIEAQKILDVPEPGQPTVALVIGYDQRAGIEHAVESRSDTVMLLRVDPEGNTISMLSFPRDLIVDIPACKGRPPLRARINEAYTYCGPKGTLQTVKDLTGVGVNYMITVNFRGFKQIVDKVGGVYLDVDRRYFNDNSLGGPSYATINLRPGYQKLAGGPALDYVRYRHTDSDFYRIKRQQEFVKSFKQRISGLVAVTKLPGIITAITENVEVARGGSKEIDFDTVYAYAKLAYELPAGGFHQIQIDPETFSGFAELSAPEDAVRTAVQQFLHPDVAAAERATTVATGKKPKEPAAPPPSEVSLEVLNGNGVAGAADEAGYLLSQRGYPVVNGGNADNFEHFHTEVVYDPSVEGADRAAQAVARLFGDGEVVKLPAEAELGTMLRIIVGQTFQNSLGPSAIDSTPKHEPPKVVKDPASVLPLIRTAERRVDFPLLVPTVREEYSRLDSGGLEPMRIYRLEGKDAVRLTYQLTETDFWGIQQTDWEDPPVLEGPSVVRRIKGRDYRLYFNGAQLHMVGFIENGSAYWVVNTVLDKLSNETMLAIAKGLKPLPSKK
jgi:LCP family protein required for cell wall assembly